MQISKDYLVKALEVLERAENELRDEFSLTDSEILGVFEHFFYTMHDHVMKKADEYLSDAMQET